VLRFVSFLYTAFLTFIRLASLQDKVVGCLWQYMFAPNLLHTTHG